MPWADLAPAVQGRIQRIRTGLLALSQAYAGTMEATLRREAPWTNVTGNARNTLSARATIFDPDPDNYVLGIVASHGVEYGVWLETKQNQYVWGRGPYPFRQETRDGVSGPWTMVVRPVVNRYRQRYLDAAQGVVNRGLRDL